MEISDFLLPSKKPCDHRKLREELHDEMSDCDIKGLSFSEKANADKLSLIMLTTEDFNSPTMQKLSGRTLDVL